MEEENGPKIIDLATERAKPRRLELVAKWGYSSRCEHLRLELDEKTRSVTCKTCGALRDPFDALLDLATHESRLIYERDRRTELLAKLEERSRVLCPTCKKMVRIDVA